MVGLDMGIQSMQLLVQNVEAEKGHFWNRDLRFNLIAIGVSMAVGVLLLVLVRGMSILVGEEFSARHR